MPRKILLIDDDALFRRSLSFHLEQAGYQVETAGSAEDGLRFTSDEYVDLILLDIGLPGMDGLEALRYFNEQIGAPIIFLTARRRELDEILGLELGADDYITKPFETSVLLARVKAVLRRTQRKEQRVTIPKAFSAGDIEIDPRAHTVTLKGVHIELTPIEFKLLNTLAQQPGHVFSADDLLRTVWGMEYVGQPQVVYVHIRALRTKLEENPNRPERIMTVRGVGYKLLVQEA
ncbi:MAG: response regulator transcription factor [Anaerolineae bacterium]|jgi:DNA-binding response OmpR family regulator|nr:response regulator transcription factor [Anaerolineae bacterium]MBT7782340.1 response regulator transcription factor [Anaerolineae bacterium]